MSLFLLHSILLHDHLPKLIYFHYSKAKKLYHKNKKVALQLSKVFCHKPKTSCHNSNRKSQITKLQYQTKKLLLSQLKTKKPHRAFSLIVAAHTKTNKRWSYILVLIKSVSDIITTIYKYNQD